MNLDQIIRSRPRGKYNIQENRNSQYWIIRLLERNPATLETISNYIKKDQRTTQQLITLLRRRGYYISLKGYGGLYELIKEKCPTCKKIINTSHGLRIHHKIIHGVRA